MFKSTFIMMLQEYIIKLIKRCPGKYNYLRSCNNYSALVVLVISTHLLKPVLATAGDRFYNYSSPYFTLQLGTYFIKFKLFC